MRVVDEDRDRSRFGVPADQAQRGGPDGESIGSAGM